MNSFCNIPHDIDGFGQTLFIPESNRLLADLPAIYWTTDKIFCETINYTRLNCVDEGFFTSRVTSRGDDLTAA